MPERGTCAHRRAGGGGRIDRSPTVLPSRLTLAKPNEKLPKSSRLSASSVEFESAPNRSVPARRSASRNRLPIGPPRDKLIDALESGDVGGLEVRYCPTSRTGSKRACITVIGRDDKILR